MIRALMVIVGVTWLATQIGIEPAYLLITVGLLWLVMTVKAKLGGSGRVAVGHSHGGPPETLLRHEGAHLTAAEKTGARVKSARVDRHSGFVRLANAEALSSRDYMAFQLSGRYGAGTRAGCTGDDAEVAAEERRMRRAGVSTSEVRRTRRLADADARRYGSSSRVTHWAAKLGKRGKL